MSDARPEPNPPADALMAPPIAEPFRVVSFDFQGEAAEIAEIVNRESARRHARNRSRRAEIAYATIVDGDRLDVFARGKNRLRIKRPAGD